MLSGQFSVAQLRSVKDKGYYTMADVLAVMNLIGGEGFTLVGYREQSYYLKTIQDNTDLHGQFKLDFLSSANPSQGLTVTGSHDCQLQLEVHAGPIILNSVIPLINVVTVKHLENQVAELNLNQVRESIYTALTGLVKLFATWEVASVTPAECIQVFDAVYKFKRTKMKCLDIEPVLCGNKLELFKFAMACHVFGKAYGKGTTRKVKALRHIRWHLYIPAFLSEVLA